VGKGAERAVPTRDVVVGTLRFAHPTFSNHQPDRMLDKVPESVEELGAERAVDHTVVA
jgi:hypothetical protein